MFYQMLLAIVAWLIGRLVGATEHKWSLQSLYVAMSPQQAHNLRIMLLVAVAIGQFDTVHL